MAVELGALHRQMADFVGKWTGDEELFASPWAPGGTASGTWIVFLDASGRNLIQDFSELRHDGSRFEAHGVLTVDPAADEYVWFWFDSFGFPPLSPSRGSWQGRVLTLEKTTPRGAGRSTFELGDGVFTHRLASKPPGAAEFSPVMVGTYRRVG